MRVFKTVAVGALLVAATVAATPLPAQAIAIAPHASILDSAYPRVMDQASVLSQAPPPAGIAMLTSKPAVIPRAARPRPQREVFGFADDFNLADPNVGYTSWNFSLLTTIAYFALHVNSGDGHLVTSDTGWAVYHSQTMLSFVNAAHAAGARVIVSINMHDFSVDPYNQVCSALIPSNAQATIAAAIHEMQWAGLDGINLNYEGTITTCADGQTNRAELVSMIQNLRAQMPAGSYLSIDTFTGSAEDNQEFFDITGLAPYVDSFFVMAYDMDFENSQNPPISCQTPSGYCFNPVSALSGYRFNVTSSMAQYTALVPASKVILGQPYYGRRGCVGFLDRPNQGRLVNTNFATPTYLFASTIPSQTGVHGFVGHRDPYDHVSEWDTWYDSDWGCNRMQYWDDVVSLGAKYNVVNADNLRGVGLFTLDYGGGAPELWALLNTYFSCPVTINLAATQTTTEFNVGLSAGSCSVAYYDVQQFDSTLSAGWFEGTAVPSGGTATAVAEGFQGTTYQFRARAHTTGGLVTSWSNASTVVSSSATVSRTYKGVYTLDGYGGIHADQSPPIATAAYWPGWRIVRGVHAWPGANAPQSGALLDGYGGLHTYGAALNIGITASWPGWDIARDFAFLPDGTGGFVLDGYGGLHPFHVNGATAPLSAQITASWPGWDIARKVVIFADGKGGYVMDGWGGLHPFGINGPPPVQPSQVQSTGYWPGWSIARDIQLVAGNGGHAGYVLDGYGGLHPFHATNDGSALPGQISAAYWGWDIGRGLFFLPGLATAGYTLDGYGGVHPFGGAPAISGQASWPGWDIAAFIWGA